MIQLKNKVPKYLDKYLNLILAELEEDLDNRYASNN